MISRGRFVRKLAYLQTATAQCLPHLMRMTRMGSLLEIVATQDGQEAVIQCS